MKQVLGIRDEKTRMKVTPPLAMAPVTQDDDMRWNPKSQEKKEPLWSCLRCKHHHASLESEPLWGWTLGAWLCTLGRRSATSGTKRACEMRLERVRQFRRCKKKE